MTTKRKAVASTLIACCLALSGCTIDIASILSRADGSPNAPAGGFVSSLVQEFGIWLGIRLDPVLGSAPVGRPGGRSF